MSTSGLQATNQQNTEELDSMKESISDIINQLQDIDPARLSFSPFLDLDTQISLAPVSDSPESSVEELHLSSHSISGSQPSLEPPPMADQPSSCSPSLRQPSVSQSEEPAADLTEEEKLDKTLSNPITTAHSLDTTTENCIGPSTPASQGDIPNGTDSPRLSPESTNLDTTVDEGRPLISPPTESVELTVWSSEERGGACDDVEEVSDPGRCCCHCCQCKCCPSARVPAFLSVLASLLCSVVILYALYFYVPIRPPDCPDLSSRVVFTLCCCVLATLPILLAMLVGAACHFCYGSLMLQESPPSRSGVQQLFVTASTQQLLLYVLNLVVMAALLPQDQLKLVPILVAMFTLGRLIYWTCVNMCSSWRGFGSGLSLFPLLAMVSLNLFLMYKQNLKEPLFSSSQDVLYNQITTSSWLGETSQSSIGQTDIQPTDILDAQ